jgi:hypothetical protein
LRGDATAQDYTRFQYSKLHLSSHDVEAEDTVDISLTGD